MYMSPLNNREFCKWYWGLPDKEWVIVTQWVRKEEARIEGERLQREQVQKHVQYCERVAKEEADKQRAIESRLAALFATPLSVFANSIGIDLHKYNKPDMTVGEMIMEVARLLAWAECINEHVLYTEIPRHLMLVYRNYVAKEAQWHRAGKGYTQRSCGWAPTAYSGDPIFVYHGGLLVLEDMKRHSFYDVFHSDSINVGQCLIEKPFSLKLSCREKGFSSAGVASGTKVQALNLF